MSAVDDPDEVARSLRAALGEAERLSRLAEDLLLLARERAGSLVVHREPVDLLDLAAAEAGRLRPALGVRTAVSGDPAVIAGDADRLRQVLANLADNSAAAGASTVRIRVVDDLTSASASRWPTTARIPARHRWARRSNGSSAAATPGPGARPGPGSVCPSSGRS